MSIKPVGVTYETPQGSIEVDWWETVTDGRLLYAIPDTHRVVSVEALNRIMELAGVALVYQPFGTKDRQHFDALMAIIEDKP